MIVPTYAPGSQVTSYQGVGPLVFLSLIDTTFQHSWAKRPRRCYEVMATCDDGDVLLAGRFTSRKRAQAFIDSDPINTQQYTIMTGRYVGQPVVGWGGFISMTIDETL